MNAWRQTLWSLPDAVPREEITTAIGELEALKVALLDRLTDPQPEPEADRLLTVHEVAEVLSVRDRWVYDRANSLPFTRRLGEKTLRFSSLGLSAWLDEEQPSDYLRDDTTEFSVTAKGDSK